MDKPRFPTGITSFFLGSAPDRARFVPVKPRFSGRKTRFIQIESLPLRIPVTSYDSTTCAIRNVDVALYPVVWQASCLSLFKEKITKETNEEYYRRRFFLDKYRSACGAGREKSQDGMTADWVGRTSVPHCN